MIKESIGKYMTRIGSIESALTLMAELINLLDWQKHNSPTLFLGLNEKI
jgi:hypothetical protein